MYEKPRGVRTPVVFSASLLVIVSLYFSLSGDGAVKNLREADIYVLQYSKNQCVHFGSISYRNNQASSPFNNWYNVSQNWCDGGYKHSSMPF